MEITKEQLKAIAPKISAHSLEIYPPLLTVFMNKYQIDSPARARPFIANLAHESAAFNRTEEYATGAAYEGRVDLGNTQPGDGVRFKGRGLIQVTGRGAYKACSLSIYGDERLIANPALLEEPEAATGSACWVWRDFKGLNRYADKPPEWKILYKGIARSKFEWIVIKINGGLNGYAEREIYLHRAEAVIK